MAIENLVYAIAVESMKGFESIAQILSIGLVDLASTDFLVMCSEVEVTETFSHKSIPIDGSESTTVNFYFIFISDNSLAFERRFETSAFFMSYRVM